MSDVKEPIHLIYKTLVRGVEARAEKEISLLPEIS